MHNPDGAFESNLKNESLEHKFENPETIEFNGELIKVVDLLPETLTNIYSYEPYGRAAEAALQALEDRPLPDMEP